MALNLAQNTASHPPLPHSALQNGNQYGAQDDCAICLCAFGTGEAVRWLPCGHLLHASCVDPVSARFEFVTDRVKAKLAFTVAFEN